MGFWRIQFLPHTHKCGGYTKPMVFFKEPCLMGNDFDFMNSGDNACLKQLNLHNFFEHSTFLDQNSPRPFLSSAQNGLFWLHPPGVRGFHGEGLFQGRRGRGLFVARLRSAGHRKEAENHQKCSYQRPPRPEKWCHKGDTPQVFEWQKEPSVIQITGRVSFFCGQKMCKFWNNEWEDVNQI